MYFFFIRDFGRSFAPKDEERNQRQSKHVGSDRAAPLLANLWRPILLGALFADGGAHAGFGILGHIKVDELHDGLLAVQDHDVLGLQVAVHSGVPADGTVQVGQGAGCFARCPDAMICGKGRVLSQRVEPAAARHPLHDDEGVGRFQARAEYLHAVRVIHLQKMSENGAISGRTACIARLEHGRDFLGELLQVARVESDFDLGSFHGGFGSV